MTRRRRIVGTSFAIVCMLLALALATLWWRSRTHEDVLGWTTEQLDPKVAASGLPKLWRTTFPYSSAGRTFSISSDDGFIRVARAVYLQRDDAAASKMFGFIGSSAPTPTFAMPYPFPQEPGWRGKYGTIGQ